MKTADIKTDGTVYAYAPIESSPLGHWDVYPVVVEAVRVPRTPMDGYQFHTKDGVKVRRTDNGNTNVVRPQAIKGTWEEHEELRKEKKQQAERFQAAHQQAKRERELLALKLQELLPDIDFRYALEDYKRGTQQLRLDTKMIRQLIDALEEM